MPKIIFRLNTGEEQVVEGKDGWSVMQIAMRNDISGIDADCGGSASCATCHVYVDDSWVSRVNAPESYETDMLDELPSRRPSSGFSSKIRSTPNVDGRTFEVPPDQTNIEAAFCRPGCKLSTF